MKALEKRQRKAEKRKASEEAVKPVEPSTGPTR
jgi:hypothetical protein